MTIIYHAVNGRGYVPLRGAAAEAIFGSRANSLSREIFILSPTATDIKAYGVA